jgi:hypothetical protein
VAVGIETKDTLSAAVEYRPAVAVGCDAIQILPPKTRAEIWARFALWLPASIEAKNDLPTAVDHRHAAIRGYRQAGRLA